eukprot:4331701-Prymnesium_polylepis.2
MVESGDAKSAMQMIVAYVPSTRDRTAELTPPKMSFAQSSVVHVAPPRTVACTCVSWRPGRINGSITTSCAIATSVPGTLVAAIQGFCTLKP